MKIAHLCLSNFYIDNFSYQENELVAQNVRDGHDVTVIASTESIGKDNRLEYLASGDYVGSDGARVIRIPYRRILPATLMRKVRAHPGVFQMLRRLSPDTMLFHGTCGWELNAAAKYVKRHKGVKLYVDSHEDFNNSARTFLSKWGLHFLFYRPILKRNMPQIEKILCVNLDAMDFVGDFYNVPKEKLEFFPLGGSVFNDDEYLKARSLCRTSLGVSDSTIVFLQSGKLDTTKKLIESLEGFAAVPNPNAVFLVVGQICDDILERVKTLMDRDKRIRFLGWQSSSQLRSLLCATDCYVQPGTQSATMQMALCCRCAVILDDVKSHQVYMNNNGWLVGVRKSIGAALVEAARSHTELDSMAINSRRIADDLLDYRRLAKRIYS